MAIAQLFFRKDNLIGSIKLDVIISEGATASARITKNPVENGADINDHIIIDPMTFIMQGVVVDTKLSLVSNLGQINTIERARSLFTKNNSSSKEAWEELLKLQVDRVPFELVTNLKTYPNVVIQSLATSQDKDTSNGLFFTATLSEIILVGEKVPTAEQYEDQNISDMAIPKSAGGFKSLEVVA